MSAESALRGVSPASELALAPASEPESIAHFLREVAPGEVLRAVRHCLSPRAPDPTLRLVRAKLKPGRKLTAEYVAVLPGSERRVAVTWVASGTAAPGPDEALEAEARRRGVLAPFSRAWAGSDDGLMSLSVSPVDGAFPQLVRLHEHRHVLDLLATSGAGAATDVLVETVRFRPGQRHVLRVALGPADPAWFVKVYRDDTGRRAVDAAARAATALAAAGNGAPAVAPVRGRYVSSDRATVWPAVGGTSLADVILLSGAAAGDLVRAAGEGLRLLHGMPPAADLRCGPDAVAQAAETLRTAQLLDVLPPAVGQQLRRVTDRVLDRLSRWPVERITTTHGDFKCENVVVSSSSLHLLDFDRCARGDPAADVGKFLADLRWWADDGGDARPALHEAFLQGYGPVGPAHTARARAYESLFLLRMAARRVALQDPDWGRRVRRAVDVAAAGVAGGPQP